METKKIKTTREKLTEIIAKYMRMKSREMGDRNIMRLPIKYENWLCGMGPNKKWSHTDITLCDIKEIVKKHIPPFEPFERVELVNKVYTLEDKELTQSQFLVILNKAIAEAGVRGRVIADTYGDGYWTPKEVHIRRVELFAKPCKEFIKLAKFLNDYAGFVLGVDEIFHVDVCGKRSSWGDSGEYNYLCYDAKRCNDILDTIKAKKPHKGEIKAEVLDYFSHGDEGDYRCAMYQESEWYGYRGNKLHITITTPTGKVKLDKEFYM